MNELLNPSTRQRSVEVALFGAVGVAASVTHFIVAVTLIERASLPAWVANICAFCCALPVSYLGHAFLTFRKAASGRETSVSRASFVRFASLAVSGFALNQSSIVLFVEILNFPHRPVLLATIVVVSAITYFAAKLWAFRR